jgi:hypothetical protein
MVTAGTQTAGRLLTELDAYRRFRNRQMLGISIHGDKFNAANLLPDHSGDGIAASPAQADDLNIRPAGDIT